VLCVTISEPSRYMIESLSQSVSQSVFPSVSHSSRQSVTCSVLFNDDVSDAYYIPSNEMMSRDSSVGIALGYGLDHRDSRVRFPAGAGNFSLHHSVQNGSGAHPASYPMGTWGSFPEGRVTGA
jgi:hypothetical protein